MCKTMPNSADWDYFKTLILLEILKTQNLHRVESCAFFGSHTFLPTSWICKKQTSVSHSSTEAEIISLDAVVRMDGIPTLDHWLLKCFILPPTENRDTKSQRRETCSSTDRQTNTPTPKPRFSYRTKILSCPMSIMSPQTWNLIAVQPCALYLEA